MGFATDCNLVAGSIGVIVQLRHELQSAEAWGTGEAAPNLAIPRAPNLGGAAR